MAIKKTRFNPYPVQWYEGMLLMPQHFQQADRLNSDLWSFHLNHLSPYYWGILEYEIDHAKLSNRIFSVISLSAIFPDGTPLFFPQGDETLELNLKDVELTEGGEIKIFLILADSSVQGSTDNVHMRFRPVEPPPVMDQNTGANEVAVTRLKPYVQLFAGSEVPSRFIGIPLAEISISGKMVEQTSYISPSLHIDQGSEIAKMCRNLIERVRSKIIYLQEKSDTSKDEDLTYLRSTGYFDNICQHLVCGLMPFEATLSSVGSHPHDVFKALMVLASHAAALQAGLYPPTLTTYRHDELREVFSELIAFIDQGLDHIEEVYVSHVFQQEDRVYSYDFQASWLKDGVFYLGVKAQPNMTTDDLIRWVNDCVIASDTFVQLVQDNRVLGAEREIVSVVPELNLSTPHESILLAVKADSRFIHPDERIHIFNISDQRDNRPKAITLFLPANSD